MKRLSHVDGEGRARMVDVHAKPDQVRVARARGHIRLAPETVALIRDNALQKGDVLAVAEVAGIQAAKQTAHLIPLCHPLALTRVQVTAEVTADGVLVSGEAACVGKTGVEMEALTGVSVALLAVYDMCKAVDKNMVIGDIALVKKTKRTPQRKHE